MTATARTGVTTYSTPIEREVVISRVLDAPRHVVFGAFTDARHVRIWMTGPDDWTMPVCAIDLRPGGAWRYVYRKANGTEMSVGGVFIEVTPPERLAATESWGPEWPETVNTTIFTESAGQTTVTITMTFPSKEARDAALRTGMRDGSDRSFAKLDRLLASSE